MKIVYIALGSNLENPRQQVETAFTELASLKQSSLFARSSLYKSKALVLPLLKAQKIPDYINAVAGIQTTLTPLELLHQCQHIENIHERNRQQKWESRTLDLDILLYGDSEINSEILNIPHPEMWQRNFVLYPLAEIAPELRFPNGAIIKDLLAMVSMQGLSRL